MYNNRSYPNKSISWYSKIDIVLGLVNILGLTEILIRNFAKHERNISGDNL